MVMVVFGGYGDALVGYGEGGYGSSITCGFGRGYGD